MKALFFGLGGIGQRHLRNLRQLCPDSQLAAYRVKGRTFEVDKDLQPDYSIDIIKKYDIEVFSSFDAALSFKPDIAIVANPTCYHVETTTRLVESEIPVFLEKPISHSREGLDSLLEKVGKRKACVMVGYMMRFHPCVQKLKEMISEQRIGRLYSVTSIINSYMPEWHCYESYEALYAGRRDLGGGVILTEIHEIDLLCWLFGKPKRLWCLGGNYSSLGIDVEDSVTVMMEQINEGSPFTTTATLSFAQRYPMRCMTLLGEDGAIVWDIIRSELTLDDEEHGVHDVFKLADFDRNDLFLSELDHFLKCVETGKQPDTSLEKVIEGHETALLMKEYMNSNITRC